jgi:hypothetical protein
MAGDAQGAKLELRLLQGSRTIVAGLRLASFETLD